MRRWSLLLILPLLVFTAGIAHARSMHIEDFDVAIEVTEDGTVTIEERIRVRFDGSWNGIYRDIRYGYTHLGGVRGRVPMSVDAVVDDDGNPLEHWKKHRKGHLNLKIRVPGAMNASRTVVIRYRVRGVIRLEGEGDGDFGLHDELYWNVTGNEWQIPIQHAAAKVRLPASVPADSLITTAYTGPRGAQGDDWREETLEDGRLRFETTEELPTYHGLTIVVGFEPGHVAHPTTGEKIGWWFKANWYVFVPIALLLVWFLMWFFRGRDSLEGRTIIPDWKAPDGMRAAEVGVLIDDSLDQRDITAAILDLAVRGVITITEDDGEYTLDLHRDRLSKTKLESFEKKIVDEIFPNAETTTDLGTLKYKFVTEIKRIRDSVLDRLVSLGYFPKRPDHVGARWAGLTVFAMIGMVVLGIFGGLPWPYYVTLALCIVPMFMLARFMPVRTKKGLDALARIKGMEDYLVTAEKTRMEKLEMSEMESLLPFAVALGLHERWAAAFGELFDEAPSFMRSNAGLRAGSLNPWIIGMNRNVGSTLMSGPRSTSSSGGKGWSGGWSGGGGFSSGGGFSGGGSGGGGGGGW